MNSDRNLVVDGMDRILSGGSKRRWISNRAYHQNHCGARLLARGEEDFWLWLRVKTELLHVVDDTNDLEQVAGFSVASVTDALPNSFAYRPPLLGKRSIHNCDVRGHGGVHGRERPSRQQLDSGGLKIICVCDIEQ